jgi:hypothetical protein
LRGKKFEVLNDECSAVGISFLFAEGDSASRGVLGFSVLIVEFCAQHFKTFVALGDF